MQLSSVSEQIEVGGGVLGDGLALHQLLGKEAVEQNEVTQFTRRVYFSLYNSSLFKDVQKI